MFESTTTNHTDPEASQGAGLKRTKHIQATTDEHNGMFLGMAAISRMQKTTPAVLNIYNSIHLEDAFIQSVVHGALGP